MAELQNIKVEPYTIKGILSAIAGALALIAEALEEHNQRERDKLDPNKI